MAKVTLRALFKRFGEVTAVNDLHLDVPEGSFVTLLGPSGCGKSTTLNCIAGLEQPTSGLVLFDEQIVNDLSPRDRDIAMVFQDYALYPHMTVFGNLAFGLKQRRLSDREIRSRVGRAADVLAISELLDRRPTEISGGQRQRVALGRAIVRDPVVFLMDEPLSNLDAALRVRTRTEIKRLQRELGVTTVYVTHDQEEAMVLSDKIAVMRAGVLQQYSTPEDTYSQPVNAYVAGFIGSPAMNFVEGQLASQDGHLLIRSGELAVPLPDSVGAVPGADRVRLGVRPEHVRVGPAVEAAGATAHVLLAEPVGPVTYLDLVVGGIMVKASVDPRLRARIGQTVGVSFEHVYLFDPVTGSRLDCSHAG
ncbi:MAG: ABC transporter ATP-binding protein [Chloroflexi bacterium]|nr:ABC transporter ATP-binding protein [Chloroflexota bacterium]